MMLEIRQWMAAYEQTTVAMFGDRVRLIGLQGSRGRGEATEHSDIDVVLLLDRVTLDDLEKYRDGIRQLPYSELICGFVSGVEELRGWDRADRFQFYFDTTPWKGVLEEVIPVPDKSDAERAVLMGCCNLYHGCSHNYIHEQREEVLAGLYKGARFVLQAKCYCETGHYEKKIKSLGQYLSGEDLDIWNLCCEKNVPAGFAEQSRVLLQWCSGVIQRYGVDQSR